MQSVLLYQSFNKPPIATPLKPGINSHFVNTLAILCSGIAFLKNCINPMLLHFASVSQVFFLKRGPFSATICTQDPVIYHILNSILEATYLE